MITAEQFIVDAAISVIDNSGESITPIIDFADVDFNTPGTYEVIVSATDSQGNTGTFEVTIFITDTTIPTINITTAELTYEIGSTLTESQVIADANISVTDNSGATIAPTLNLSVVNANVLGSYEVMVNAKDTSNNEALVATITIHIVDTEAPSITGLMNITYEVGTSITSAQLIIDANLNVLDNSGEALTPTVDLSAVDFTTPGAYVAIVSATDSSENTAIFEVMISIIDSNAPVIEITTTDLTYEINTTLTEAQIIADANIIVTDNSNMTITPTIDLSLVSVSLVGTYEAAVSAKDSTGNVAITATITIHIVDTIAPHISGATTLTYEAGTLVTPTQFIETADIIVTDNSGETITPTVDLSTVNFNAVGTYGAIVSATDSQGNLTTYEVIVLIEDTTDPVIDITTTDLSYEIGTMLTQSQVIIDANITITDNAGGMFSPQFDLSLVNINQLGTYTIEVTATDTSGNVATGTITIHIVDTIAPTITGNNHINYEVGENITETQMLLDAEIEITDNSGENITPTIDISNVNFNLAGTYQAIVNATDSSGNQAIEFVITVDIFNPIDIIAPLIEITTDELTYEIGTVLTTAQVIADANITVRDNRDAVVTPIFSLSTVNTNVLGTYTVIVTAEDAAHNFAIEDIITIHIVDTIPPTITADTHISYPIGTMVTKAQFIEDTHIMVTDNSGEVLTPVVDWDSVNFGIVDTYTATVSATDSSANQAIPVNITVNIFDDNAPTLQIGTTDVTYEIRTTLTEAQVIADANITATDNSNQPITPMIDLSSVDVNQLGTYVAVVSAVDTENNSVQGNVNIHIVDTHIPVINGKTTLSYDVGTSITTTQFLTDAEIVVTDNSEETIIPTIAITPLRLNAQDRLETIKFDTIGTYLATITAVDMSGNEAIAFNVTVEIGDNIAPIITIPTTEVTYEIWSTITEDQVIADAGITVKDNSGVIIKPQVDLSQVNIEKLGTYIATVTAEDTTNNQSAEGIVTIHIVDTVIPIITTTKDKLSYKVGTTLTEAKIITDAGITITDNSKEEILPVIDLVLVNTNAIGTYTIDVNASDSSNNFAVTKQITVEINNTNSGNNNQGNGQQELVTTGENSYLNYILGLFLILLSSISLLIVKRKIRKS